ncbi:MAG TPA: zinc ABC transporter substrate-binding protein [Chthoniobacterales bacterium]
MKRVLVFLAAAAQVCVAFAAEPVKVVSFSTILGEIATAVGGEKVDVVELVKPNVDPHEYQPTPADLEQLSNAALILASGKNLEHYIDKLSASAGAATQLVKVGDHFPSLQLEEEGQMVQDPHWWQSVADVERATRVIRDALIQIDSADKALFTQNADRYLAKLTSLDEWVREKIAELPRDKRKLVTSHDAFQYFAKDYGFTIQSIEGISTDQEPSAKQVNDLIETIRREGVKAIFLEDKLNPKVSSEITRDTGATIGGTLYADGLGDAPGNTYEGMIKHNVSTIVDALK